MRVVGALFARYLLAVCTNSVNNARRLARFSRESAFLCISTRSASEGIENPCRSALLRSRMKILDGSLSYYLQFFLCGPRRFFRCRHINLLLIDDCDPSLKAKKGSQEIAEDTETTAPRISVTSACSCSIFSVAAGGRAGVFRVFRGSSFCKRTGTTKTTKDTKTNHEATR